MIKERIMQLAKEGRTILDLDDVVEANYISSQTMELCTIQFGNLEPVVLLKPWFLSPNTKERLLSAAFLDKTIVNMTSCSVLEEETDEEGVSKENCEEETERLSLPLRLCL